MVARRQIAQVLVASLTSDAARHKTLELVAEAGPGQGDLEPLFAALVPDPPGSLDGAEDATGMPPASEPTDVRQDLTALKRG